MHQSFQGDLSWRFVNCVSFPHYVQVKKRHVRRGRDKSRLENLEQFEELSDRGDDTRDMIRHRVRQMLSDSPIEGNKGSNPCYYLIAKYALIYRKRGRSLNHVVHHFFPLLYSLSLIIIINLL